MLEEAGLGACRVGCAEQEVDLAALAELGREWKATMDDGGSPLFDDLQALDIAPWTLEAAAFRDLAVAVGIESERKFASGIYELLTLSPYDIKPSRIEDNAIFSFPDFVKERI
jgi:hypothetical protein